MNNTFKFNSKLTRYAGEGAWYFVTLPRALSSDIKLFSVGNTVGLGYVRVEVTLGRTIWKTTLFPSKTGKYYLAIKAEIRKKEALQDGDVVRGLFELI